jgi:hypothetical protein
MQVYIPKITRSHPSHRLSSDLCYSGYDCSKAATSRSTRIRSENGSGLTRHCDTMTPKGYRFPVAKSDFWQIPNAHPSPRIPCHQANSVRILQTTPAQEQLRSKQSNLSHMTGRTERNSAVHNADPRGSANTLPKSGHQERVGCANTCTTLTKNPGRM